MNHETEPGSGTPEWFRFALSHHMKDGRCSSCLIDQMVAGWRSRDLDFFAVANEITLLEEHPNARRTNTKSATLFKKGSLRGFGQKHYFQSRFTMRNIRYHWLDLRYGSSPKLDKLIQKLVSDPEIHHYLKIN